MVRLSLREMVKDLRDDSERLPLRFWISHCGQHVVGLATYRCRPIGDDEFRFGGEGGTNVTVEYVRSATDRSRWFTVASYSAEAGCHVRNRRLTRPIEVVKDFLRQNELDWAIPRQV